MIMIINKFMTMTDREKFVAATLLQAKTVLQSCWAQKTIFTHKDHNQIWASIAVMHQVWWLHTKLANLNDITASEDDCKKCVRICSKTTGYEWKLSTAW
jgi:hypothetical protein